MPEPILRQGIEYNEEPPPSVLVKAMTRQRALQLIDEGEFRLSKPSYYRTFENPELRDQNEGIGSFTLNGKEIFTESGNDVFIWGTSLEDVNLDMLLQLSQTYDTIVSINNPEEFFQRILSYIRNNQSPYHLHCGRVTYNRAQVIAQQTLRGQRWHYNVFQKDIRDVDQVEYRISLTRLGHSIEEEHLHLTIGNCQDIISIEDLA